MTDAPTQTDPVLTGDPRDLFRTALNQVEELIAIVDTDQLTAPTPCEQFDVRALMRHIIGALSRMASAMSGAPIPQQAEVDAAMERDDWLSAFADARFAYQDAWSADDALAQQVQSVRGPMCGADLMRMLIVEITAHGYDLAVAIGSELDRDPGLGEAALAIAKATIPAEPRPDGGPFGPVVQARSSDPYDQLAAWLGRKP